MTSEFKLLDTVALLQPMGKLCRGNVGTIVEKLTSDTFLIEFSDEEGRAKAIEPVKESLLLKLHYEPLAA